MIGYIYKTTNLLNDKIYIGQHKYYKYELDSNYFGSGKLLQEAIKKYGIENFKCEILEWCNTEEELEKKEIYYIDLYKSKVTFGNYNISDGGFVPRLSGELNGNYGKHRPKTEEEKRHLSEVAKGHKPTFTRKHTLEERQKMSVSGKQNEHNLYYKDYKHISNHHKGSKMMTNGEEQKWVYKDSIDKMLDEGWIFGSCKKRTFTTSKIPWNKGRHGVQKNCKSTEGYIRVTNGKINTTIKQEQLEEFIEKGFIRGITRKNKLKG